MIVINRRILTGFLTIEAILYVSFLTLDILSVIGEYTHDAGMEKLYSTALVIKYISVSLCLLAAVIRALWALKDPKASDECGYRIMIASALVFTVTADWFIVFGNENLIGIFSFCAVQTIYIFVIESKKAFTAILVRIIICASAVLALHTYFPDDMLLIGAALFYGISFIGNVIHQSIKTHRTGTGRLFLAGLILFVLCDINVLFYNLGGFVNIGLSYYDVLQSISLVLMWAFYLPSQVLIVLSSRSLR